MSALAVEVIDPPQQQRERCKHGHDLTQPGAVAMRRDSKGVERGVCRECRRLSVQRVRARQRGDDRVPILPRSFSPRTGRLRSAEDELPVANTNTMLGQMSVRLRRSVARLILDDRTDPVVRRIVKRAATKSVYVGAGDGIVAALFIEEIARICTDARDPKYHADAVLEELLAGG